MLLCYFLRFVGMNPDRGVNPIVLLGEGHRRIELLGAWACADGEECRDSGGACAIKHGSAVFGELWEVDVRVRIDQFHS